MARQNINIILKSKIFVAVVLVVLLLLGVLQVAQGVFDEDAYRQRIEALIKERTGRTITIHGEVAFAILPTPTVYLPQVEVRNTSDDVVEPEVNVDMVVITSTFASVFTETPEISAITFEQPLLKLSRHVDGMIHR